MNLLLILSLLFIVYYMYSCTRKQPSQSTYISSSAIQGQGLFASSGFSKDDIILDNVFPNKSSNETLY